MSTDAQGSSPCLPAAAVVEGMYALDDQARGVAYPTPEHLERDEEARRDFGDVPGLPNGLTRAEQRQSPNRPAQHPIWCATQPSQIHLVC